MEAKSQGLPSAGPPGSMQKRRKGLEGKYVNGLMGREEWEGEERGGKGREEAEGEEGVGKGEYLSSAMVRSLLP